MEYVINYGLYFIALVAVFTPVLGFGIFAPGIATATIGGFIWNWISQFFQTDRFAKFKEENKDRKLLKFVLGDEEHKEDHASASMWVEDGEGDEEEEHDHHVISIGTYAVILGILFVGTLITVAVAQVDLGKLNMVIAMAVASVKAFFVLAYFMHLKYDNMLNRVIFLSAFGFLALLLGFTMLDILSRILPEIGFTAEKYF
ncbi:cytochrome c oxidase polypeptide IVB [Leptospira ognonensis]|uniref:Cytochrome c oxidase polypeptide IVB n=1 Tax=Leptospira ognonensis TaxID=2484945 RepID=A0A4V3JRY2_9LEPT|nr:cytochrome C oxidase subunit IV family protein [Leptospira ognonensis]TGL62181.1 cytochrome c oxidase polypeptide IVB [Leptospira ognonensis]